MLGLIISGYGKPDRWITPIKTYEDLQDGRAYTQDLNGNYHFDNIEDIVNFNPEDNTGALGSNYYKIPHEHIEYIKA